MEKHTSSTRVITAKVLELYDSIVNSALLVRRVNITANHLAYEWECETDSSFEQTDMFTDYTHAKEREEKEQSALEKERRIQKATIELKNRFGKNAIIRGTNLQEGATTIERNRQIGGHRA